MSFINFFFFFFAFSHSAYQGTTSDQERSMLIRISHEKSIQQYPGSGALVLFLHPHTLEFPFQNKKIIITGG